MISAENGAFAENTILSAVEITNQEAKEAVQDIIDEDVIDAVGVDLNFYLNDEEVQPVEGKQVTVQINLKQKLNKIDKSKTIVIHEHINTANNEVENKIIEEAVVKDTKVSFNTDSFSTFYIGTLADGNMQVSSDGNTYATIQEAINNANEASTIVIISDQVINAPINIPSGKKITIKDDGNIRKISGAVPLFNVEIGGELTFEATSDENLLLLGGNASGYNATIVKSSGVVNIKSVTIEGGNASGMVTGAILANSGSILNMSGGIVQNTSLNSDYGAAIVVDSGAQFNLSGGTIQNNKNTSKGTFAAGGVLLSNWNSTQPETTMNMTGGKITGNLGGNGGGVNLNGRTTFTLNDGEISNNSTVGQGGGVCVTGVDASSSAYKLNKFIMNGGKIIGNSAHNGGGIYVNSDEVYLNGGYIENNSANYIAYDDWTGHGGGIYVSAVPRVLHVNDAIITDNKAVAMLGIGGTSGMGGGLWACPTGSIDLKVTNGVAIYGNSAVGAGAAGDDVVKVEYANSAFHGKLTIADRLLGGGEVKWYLDGGIIGNAVGTVDDSIARYNANNPGLPQHLDKFSENIALKAVVTPEAIARAEKEAKLYIRNNTASHGGGIGTNGDLTLKDISIPDWKLEVTKEWVGVVEDKQVEVEIFLKIGETILDSVKLNKNNSWKASFNQLPDPSSISEPIKVVEGKIKTNSDGSTVFEELNQYEIDYATVIDNPNNTINVKITNTNITREITVEKIWNAPKVNNIRVNLLNGNVVVASQILNDANGWKYTFDNLDKFDSSGNEIVYTVKEEAIAGYVSAISGDMENGFKITNSTSDKIEIKVNKQWIGNPVDKITVRLFANEQEVASVELNSSNGWQHTFINLDKFKDGKEIKYSISEDKVAGYSTSITGDYKTGFTIINKKNEENNKSFVPPKTGNKGSTLFYGMIFLTGLFISCFIFIYKKTFKI